MGLALASGAGLPEPAAVLKPTAVCVATRRARTSLSSWQASSRWPWAADPVAMRLVDLVPRRQVESVQDAEPARSGRVAGRRAVPRWL